MFKKDTPKKSSTAVVIVPWSHPKDVGRTNVTSGRHGRSYHRSAQERLEEAVGLAQAIHLQVQATDIVHIRNINPSKYLNTGQAERIPEIWGESPPEIVIVDTQLSPIQQRNLEKLWEVKVIDRTGLILEIFGDRARTAEGRLQVELASLTYQRSRLVRSWTHLERQRGGYGFLGGPGESQIEIDRRLIDHRVIRLKKELEKVRRTRKLHRKKRQAVPYPIVALLGYTNAGKSTLFNRLTGAGVVAEDLLFATLDTTMRALRLPSGRRVIFSDTVGFISDLPTQLVAAFRATLEELQEADLLVHVMDIAHPDVEAQSQDVLEILEELDLQEKPIIQACNKSDLLPPDQRIFQGKQAKKTALISALTGEGISELLNLVENSVQSSELVEILRISSGAGAQISWAHEHGVVLEKWEEEGGG
ncbi:MAG: GTPase HflX, partial [bacterium]|nr:GTPase HflX [bacterium]